MRAHCCNVFGEQQEQFLPHVIRVAIIGTGHTAKIRYCALIEVYAAAHVRKLHSAAAQRLM
jgi:hypothetical protein